MISMTIEQFDWNEFWFWKPIYEGILSEKSSQAILPSEFEIIFEGYLYELMIVEDLKNKY